MVLPSMAELTECDHVVQCIVAEFASGAPNDARASPLAKYSADIGEHVCQQAPSVLWKLYIPQVSRFLSALTVLPSFPPGLSGDAGTLPPRSIRQDQK